MRHFSLPISVVCLLSFYLTPTNVSGQESNLQQSVQEKLAADLNQQGVLAQFGTTRFRPPKGVQQLLLSPDEKYLVSLSDSISIWDAESGIVVRKLESAEIPAREQNSSYGKRPLVFSATTGRLIGLGRAGLIAEYDPTNNELNEIPIDSSLPLSQLSVYGSLSLDLSKDDQYLAVGSSFGIAVFNSDREEIWALENDAAGPVDLNGNDRLGMMTSDYSMLRISPKEEIIAYTMSKHPKTLAIANLATGEEIRRISLADKLVRMDFSPDGGTIAVTERDSSVRLYRVKDGEKIWEFKAPLNNPYENYTSDVAFEPTGKKIAVCATDNRIYILDSATGNVSGHLVGHEWYPWALAFSQKRQQLYSSGWDGKIRRWDLESYKELPLPNAEYASSIISFSPSGQRVAVVYEKGRIAVLAADGFTEQISWKANEIECSSVNISGDDRLLAYGGATKTDVHVVVVDLETKKEIRHWHWPLGKDPHSTVECLKFSIDGKRLAAAVFRQNTAYLMSLDEPNQKESLQHPEIYGLDFSPDGKKLLTAGWDTHIRTWNPVDGKLVSKVDVTIPNQDQNQRLDQRMYSIAAYPFGNIVATADMDSTVRIWQLGEQIQLMSSISQTPFVYGALDLTCDGVWLLTGASSGEVKIWNALSGALALDLGKHFHHVHTVGFGKDVRQVCSGSSDGICNIWNTKRTNASDPATIDEWLEKLNDDSEEMAFQAILRAVEYPEVALKRVKLELNKFDGAESPDPRIAPRLVSLLGMLKTADSEDYLRELVKRGENDPIQVLAKPLVNGTQK